MLRNVLCLTALVALTAPTARVASAQEAPPTLPSTGLGVNDIKIMTADQKADLLDSKLNLTGISAGDPVSFCRAVVDQGLRDVNATSFTKSSYLVSRNTICDNAYSSYSSASSLAASGGINIIDILGITGSDDQRSQAYGQKWREFCQANYSQVDGSQEFRTISERASSAILASFDHCIDTLGERTVRYIVPAPGGAGFTIHVERHANGAQPSPEISGVDMLDTNAAGADKFLPIENCEYQNRKLTKDISTHPVKPRDNSNQLTVTCSKPTASLVTVTVISSAGNLPAINVPESPPIGPTIAERLSALEQAVRTNEAATQSQFGADEKKLSMVMSLAATVDQETKPVRPGGQGCILVQGGQTIPAWRNAGVFGVIQLTGAPWIFSEGGKFNDGWRWTHGNVACAK